MPGRVATNHTRTGTTFLQNPKVAVALFAGVFAFTGFLTMMGMMNATPSEGKAIQESTMSIVSRILFRTQQLWERDRLAPSRFVSSLESNDPILVMGLPRSGSLSIHDFFMCNQVKSSHYCCDASDNDNAISSQSSQKPRTMFPCRKDQITCGRCVLENMRHVRPPLEGCGNYKVWSQFDVETSEPFAWFLPQHFTLPLLQEAYPDATIILNRRRDAGVWADSVLHWHSVTTRIFHSFNLDMIEPKDLTRKPKKITFNALLADMQKSLNRVLDEKDHLRKRDLLIEVYNRHSNKVRNWAREYNHRLIELVVDDPNAGATLAAELMSLSSRDCWRFDANKLDNDWKDFSFPFDDLEDI